MNSASFGGLKSNSQGGLSVEGNKPEASEPAESKGVK